MILAAPSPCLPAASTVQQLFSAARDARIVPDVSLDPVLTSFLSLDSAAALEHRYGFLRRGLGGERQAAFHQNLTARLGGRRVTNGGVGVVALALSLLLDQVAQHVRAAASPPGSEPQTLLGVGVSSRIGSMILGFLRLVPPIANDPDKMAEAAELYDAALNLELIDQYDRMTTKRRMSSEAMRQWLTGAAFHLHLRIHQVRLHSVPSGSIESLRLSYKTGLNRLVSGYVSYLRQNVVETEAGGTLEPKRSSGSSIGNETVHRQADAAAGDRRRCGRPAARNASAAPCFSQLGLLVIEPHRAVSHGVRHRACESAAIQQALVTRIMEAQDLQRSRSFFLYPEKVLRGLMAQRQHFELRANRSEPRRVGPTGRRGNDKLPQTTPNYPDTWQNDKLPQTTLMPWQNDKLPQTTPNYPDTWQNDKLPQTTPNYPDTWQNDKLPQTTPNYPDTWQNDKLP